MQEIVQNFSIQCSLVSLENVFRSWADQEILERNFLEIPQLTTPYFDIR